MADRPRNPPRPPHVAGAHAGVDAAIVAVRAGYAAAGGERLVRQQRPAPFGAEIPSAGRHHLRASVGPAQRRKQRQSRTQQKPMLHPKPPSYQRVISPGWMMLKG